MSDPLTPERLAEIRRRHDAAPQGPYFAKTTGHGIGRITHIAFPYGDTDSMDWSPADYEFLAASWADIRDLLAEVERLSPKEFFRCHHCGGEYREAPAMTMAVPSNEPYPASPPDPLCADCALKAVDGSRVRALEAVIERLRDPWRRTAEEKPPDGMSVYVRQADAKIDQCLWHNDRGLWYSGRENEFYDWEAFPHWMPMQEMPLPKERP